MKLVLFLFVNLLLASSLYLPVSFIAMKFFGDHCMNSIIPVFHSLFNEMEWKKNWRSTEKRGNSSSSGDKGSLSRDIWAGTWGRNSVVLGREYSEQWSKMKNEHGYRISSFAQGCRELERTSLLSLQWKKEKLGKWQIYEFSWEHWMNWDGKVTKWLKIWSKTRFQREMGHED